MRSRYQGSPTITAADAAAKLSELVGYPVDTHDLDYWAWPQSFGSTAGPFGGIGGAAITDFTMEAWACDLTCAILFCNGRVLEVTNSFAVPQVEAWTRPEQRKPMD